MRFQHRGSGSYVSRFALLILTVLICCTTLYFELGARSRLGSWAGDSWGDEGQGEGMEVSGALMQGGGYFVCGR